MVFVPASATPASATTGRGSQRLVVVSQRRSDAQSTSPAHPQVPFERQAVPAPVPVHASRLAAVHCTQALVVASQRVRPSVRDAQSVSAPHSTQRDVPPLIGRRHTARGGMQSPLRLHVVVHMPTSPGASAVHD